MKLKHGMYGGLIAALVFTAAAWAAVDPVEVEVHFQNGVKFMKRGLYEKSIKELEKALALDPAHAEAGTYLEQVKELYGKASPVAAKASEDQAMRVLYQDGRALFKKGEYEKAIEVFNKILAKKPVDDFASFYRERSEIMIARRMHKERKAQERQRRIEDRVRQKDLRRLSKEKKITERQEKIEKRALIQEERRQARQEKVVKASPAVSEEAEALTPRQAKIRAARERREEALRRAQERREEKRQARLDKIDARAQARARLQQKREARRDSKNIEKEQVREKKESVRAQKALSVEAQRENKELFIMGLEAYSQKEYDRAVGFFNQLIDAEKETGPVYTSTAQRMIDKAQKRQEGVGQDVAI